jgi:cation diffusion facilitator CzcD-associated flavoprotein CzcO
MNQPHDPDTWTRTALRMIGPDPANWVPDRADIDHNVAIIGGGQSGSALSFALRRAGIGKVTIIDAAPNEDRSGIWLNAARMNMLRTPKTLPGPEQGIPALSFQAWYEARHGQAAYNAIERIARTDWAAYLSWYRQLLGITIRYSTRVDRIEPAGDHFRLHLETPDGALVETARKIIIATGFRGGGDAYVPATLTDNLPTSRYSHTEDVIDFAALRGKTVGVIGAAASAFDAAGVALEHGAAAVHLFCRRPTIPATPVIGARFFPGAIDNFPQLPDATRWLHAVRFFRAGSMPTTDAIERAVAFPNFHLHLDAPWTNAAERDGMVETTIKGRVFRLDHVIAGTGYTGDLAARPELREFAGKIMRWRDRYTPPPGEEDAMLGAYPYLGVGHELTEKTPGAAPLLRHIHVQNPSGFVSLGLPIGDIPCMKRDIPVLTSRISADLFECELEALSRRMVGDVPLGFTEEIYRAAVR